MKSRGELHRRLMEYCDRLNNYNTPVEWPTISDVPVSISYDTFPLCKAVYFQPPENLKLEYPCIIYRRAIDKTLNADDQNYFYMNQYELTVIEKNPVVPLAEAIIKDFHYASILNRYTIDNLYHTIIRLYY